MCERNQERRGWRNTHTRTLGTCLEEEPVGGIKLFVEPLTVVCRTDQRKGCGKKGGVVTFYCKDQRPSASSQHKHTHADTQTRLQARTMEWSREASICNRGDVALKSGRIKGSDRMSRRAQHHPPTHLSRIPNTPPTPESPHQATEADTGRTVRAESGGRQAKVGEEGEDAAVVILVSGEVVHRSHPHAPKTASENRLVSKRMLGARRLRTAPSRTHRHVRKRARRTSRGQAVARQTC